MTSRKIKLEDWNTYYRALNNIVSDLYSAWSGDPNKSVGYSRGKGNFLRGGAYWDHVNDRALLSSPVYLKCIDILSHPEVGFIENKIAEKGKSRLSSRMKALPRLIKLIEDSGVCWPDIGFDPSAGAVVMKAKTNKKSKEQRRVPLPEDPEFDLQQAEANIRRLNENLLTTFINLNVSDQTLAEIMQRIFKEDEISDDPIDPIREPFELSNRRLRRIFANGTYADGGRFYGGWWQGLPSEYRKHIEIDGAVTVECDYATMQPRVLYAEVDIEPPEDSYRLPNWPGDMRPIAKKAFSQLINCKEGMRDPQKWSLLPPAISPDPLPDNWTQLSKHKKTELRRREFKSRYGKSYDELLHDLLNLHAPIDAAFFSQAWARMQRKDADIAEQIMLRMLDQDFTVLPIHDSFIVRRGGEGLLFEIMKTAFEEVVGKEAKIDREAIFPSPFDKHLEKPMEERLIWTRDLIPEVKESIIERTTYNRNEVQWQKTWGPL